MLTRLKETSDLCFLEATANFLFVQFMGTRAKLSPISLEMLNALSCGI